MEKEFYTEVDIVTKEGRFVAPGKMPRTAIIPVVRDEDTGYLNAAPYSAGVLSIDPIQVIFGVKSWDSKFTFRDAEEFVVAVPRRDQIDHMWAMACSVPKGINEIEIAGWTELPSTEVDTPGIKECPLNLECRKAHFIQLKQPMRALVIGEVVGVSIDSSLLKLSRSDVVSSFPMHEATSNPYTGLYGPSVLSGELIGNQGPRPKEAQRIERGDKTHVKNTDLRKPENQALLMNAIWPRPSYIVLSQDGQGNPNGVPVSGGLLMSARPSIQVPIDKNSSTYRNIKEKGEFVVSIPVRSQIPSFESIEKNAPDGFETAGFTLVDSKQTETPSLLECPVNIECELFLLEEIPGANYALLVGKKVGLSVDKKIVEYESLMQLYSQYLYAVMDWGMVRRWGFHDIDNLSVKPLPTWGSRYHGGWWTGPEQYQAGMHFWLLELVLSGYLSEEEYYKIRRWLSWWRREGFPAPEPLRGELKERLTSLFKMMVWAHRDYDKWHEIHEYLKKFPYEGIWLAP
jgi:flavin reductase (DIM6/NTAB) family NADH-FMN oxidoreductase RutF